MPPDLTAVMTPLDATVAISGFWDVKVSSNCSDSGSGIVDPSDKSPSARRVCVSPAESKYIPLSDGSTATSCGSNSISISGICSWVDEAGRLSGLGVGVGSGLRVWMESCTGCDAEPVVS